MIDVTDIWTDMSFGWYDRWTVDMTDIQMDRSFGWYDRQMSCLIHLNHTCDATPPQSTVMGVVVWILNTHSSIVNLKSMLECKPSKNCW